MGLSWCNRFLKLRLYGLCQASGACLIMSGWRCMRSGQPLHLENTAAEFRAAQAQHCTATQSLQVQLVVLFTYSHGVC